MDLTAWEKKTVTLDWAGLKLPFRVAQELFSSHDIDQGTKLLLRSLDLGMLPERPVVLDFGCGYGPLGLAVKARLPAARVVLIDRDALAVEFAAWNARQLDLPGGEDDVVAHGGLDFGSAHAPDGYDLILWNVPGKAGEPVLRGLTADAPHALKPGGLLALVVVNPLADVIRDAVASHGSLSVTQDERHTAHTIIHVRREGGGQRLWPLPPAFRRGVFDRPVEELEWRGDSYVLQPVIRLPEYNAPDYTSALLMETFDSLAADGAALAHMVIQNPGHGHGAVRAALLSQPARIELIDRDLLALEATQRNLGANGVTGGDIHPVHALLPPMPRKEECRCDLVLVRLESQLSSSLASLLHRCYVEAMGPRGVLLVGGTSTSISRFLAVANKEKAFKAVGRKRRKGASAAVLVRR